MLFTLVSNKPSIRLSGTRPIKGLIPAALTELESPLPEVRGQRQEEKRDLKEQWVMERTERGKREDLEREKVA